jgi:hypothetical protein
MSGITISENDHNVVITVDIDIVERWRIEQALSLLEIAPRDYPHIPSIDSEEQAEIAASLSRRTPEDRKYTVIREG